MKLKTKENAVISSVYGENITINLKELMNKRKIKTFQDKVN